jgi:UDP-glucose 4-epimerase
MTGVLVTGATTPFGAATVRALLDDADVDQVVAVALEPRRDGFPRDDRLRYVVTDLTRSRNVRDLLWGAARDVDRMVHAAQHRSVAHVGRQAQRLHVDATRLLLRLAEEHNSLRRFVFRSTGAVYRISATLPTVIDERHPIELNPQAPQWIRDRVEADIVACTLMGMSDVSVAVLRCAECVEPHMGSQLHDYLSAPVCFRPLGFDPMINIISVDDMVRATLLALKSERSGIYNIPGGKTLPLSELIREFGHLGLPAPGFLMAPLYRARAWLAGSEFRYDLNHWRFHFNGVLSGERAARDLGYEPAT